MIKEGLQHELLGPSNSLRFSKVHVNCTFEHKKVPGAEVLGSNVTSADVDNYVVCSPVEYTLPFMRRNITYLERSPSTQ